MTKEELLQSMLMLDPRLAAEEKANCAAIKVPADALLAVAARLKDDPAFRFDFLLSHTAVHWLEQKEFELLYRLYSTTQRHHVLLTTRIPVETPHVASLAPVWRIAEWQEREVFDLFGVLYTGHPDLRRLFLDDEWQGYPLRKDYKDDFMLEGP